MAAGLVSWDTLQYRPKSTMGPDDRELFDQLVCIERRLEDLRDALQMLPGGQNNPEFLETCQRIVILMWDKLDILNDLSGVPLDAEPGAYPLARACWEINAFVEVMQGR